nr:MAG TPA: hypothetical protein [Caudoviricetes sp.]DAO43228.1 MAG TPA: hypothetical protein [Caudoviricetes sp.]
MLIYVGFHSILLLSMVSQYILLLLYHNNFQNSRNVYKQM